MGPKADVLVISERSPFMVHALCEGIMQEKYTLQKIKPRIKDYMEVENQTYAIFIYIDEYSNELVKLLLFLKSKAENGDMPVHIYLFGDVEYIHKAYGLLGEKNIKGVFTRPINMKEVIEEIEVIIGEARDEFERPHILVVDDSVAFLERARQMMERKFNVHMANSGFSAITFLAKNKADLILLDYDMPVVPGPHVMAMIRSEESLSDSPIVIMLDKGDKPDGNELFEMHADGYVIKDIAGELFLGEIEKQLGKTGCIADMQPA